MIGYVVQNWARALRDWISQPDRDVDLIAVTGVHPLLDRLRSTPADTLGLDELNPMIDALHDAIGYSTGETREALEAALRVVKREAATEELRRW